MTFPEMIADAMPPDNEMVIGTVVSGNPLTVNVRGATQTPGRLSTTGLVTGDTVALIREGATWLALGKMISGSSGGLGLTSLHMSAATANLALTAAEQDVPGTTINFTTTSAQAFLVAWWFADYEVIAASTSIGSTKIRVDGTTNTANSANCRQTAVGDRATTAQADLQVLAPGSHTAVLRANRILGADGQLRVNLGHTTLTLAVFE